MMSPDAGADPLDQFRPEDPRIFSVFIEFEIGPSDAAGAELFGLTVCSPQWLADHPRPKGFEFIQATLVVDVWDVDLVVRAVNDWGADAVVVEINQGGAMVKHVLRLTPGGEYLNIKEVWATRGKYLRAEPVSNLYGLRKFHPVGQFARLEDEMCSYVPGAKSPNRLDAKVWASTELVPNAGPPPARRPSFSEVAW